MFMTTVNKIGEGLSGHLYQNDWVIFEVHHFDHKNWVEHSTRPSQKLWESLWPIDDHFKAWQDRVDSTCRWVHVLQKDSILKLNSFSESEWCSCSWFDFNGKIQGFYLHNFELDLVLKTSVQMICMCKSALSIHSVWFFKSCACCSTWFLSSCWDQSPSIT